MRNEEIEAIRQAANIVDIISDYIPLTKKGNNYVAPCPFHKSGQERTPSFTVSKDKQIFNCFACNKGGNVFSFIMDYQGVGFLEAVKTVADKVGIEFKYNTKNTKTETYKKEFETMDLACKFYLNNLNTKNGVEAKKYLLDRGIDDEIIKEFEIGLSTQNRTSLYDFLTKQGVELQTIDNIGLINKNGVDIYDTFLNRIMIPIKNINGQVVGFTGRIYHDEDQAKYVNSKETVIFKKSEIIFNFDKAKNYAKQEKQIIVVEGNMDAIKMFASGIKNVVALQGTSLTKFQLDVFKKLNIPVIVMLDNDAAGLNATLKNGELLHNYGIETKVVRLTGYKDPDEYVRGNGVEALISNINNATTFVDFKINYLINNTNFNSSIDVADFIKETAKLLKTVDPVTQDVILSKLENNTTVSVEIIKNELRNNLYEEKKIETPKTERRTNISKKRSKYDILCKKILFYLLNGVKYINVFRQEIGYFEEKKERELFNEINYFYKNNQDVFLADFITHINGNQELSEMVNECLNENNEEELNYDSFIEYISLMKKEMNKIELEKTKKQVKSEMDIDAKVKLIEKLAKLKKGCVDNEKGD